MLETREKKRQRTERLGVAAAATSSPSLYTSTLQSPPPSPGADAAARPPSTRASCVHSPRGNCKRCCGFCCWWWSSSPSLPSLEAGSAVPRGASGEQAVPVAL